MLTEKEYVAREGRVCPYCGCDDLSYGDSEFGGRAWQQVACLRPSCEAEWWDVYRLIRFEPLFSPKRKKRWWMIWRRR